MYIFRYTGASDMDGNNSMYPPGMPRGPADIGKKQMNMQYSIYSKPMEAQQQHPYTLPGYENPRSVVYVASKTNGGTRSNMPIIAKEGRLISIPITQRDTIVQMTWEAQI